MVESRRCSACGADLIMVFDSHIGRYEPIEAATGINHFRTDPAGAREFGNPVKHPLDFCLVHRKLYDGPRCWRCAEEKRRDLVSRSDEQI